MLQRHTIETKGSAISEIDKKIPDQFYDLSKRYVEGPAAFDKTTDVDGGITNVRICPSDSSENPKHIYVNVSTLNQQTNTGIRAEFNIDFNQPFLHNTEKYYLTVAKGTFPTTSIPLLTFNLLPTPDFYIAMNYQPTSGASSLFVVYLKPINLTIRNGAYYIYHYQQLIDSVNVAIAEAFNLIVVNQPTFTGTVPPYIVYDKPTNRFSLIFQQGIWSIDHGVNGRADLLFNIDLYRYFNSFPAKTFALANGENPLLMTLSDDGKTDSKISNAVNPLYANTMRNITNAWDYNVQYVQGAVVSYEATPGVFTYYAAIQNNENLIPPFASAYWQLQTEGPIWSAATTYVIGQTCYYPTLNSVPFVSLQYPNLNQTPVPGATTAFWKPLGGGYPTTWSSTATYAIGQNVYYPNINSGNIYTSTTAANLNHVPDYTGANWSNANAFNADIVMGEFSTLAQWQDIESIVIQSVSLPVRNEIYTPPQLDAGRQSDSQVPRPVIMDIDLLKGPDGFDRSPVQYVPTGPYRTYDLLNKPELKRIDVNIQYKHKDLTFSDLIMLPGDYFSIKFLFIRNDAFNVV